MSAMLVTNIIKKVFPGTTILKIEHLNYGLNELKYK